MPHRAWTMSLILLLLVGCAGDETATTATSGATVTTATTGTTVSTPSTTAPVPETATTVPMAEPAGAPTTALDSFTATSAIEVAVGGDPVMVTTEGTRVGEAFECTTTVDVAGMTVETAAVVTLDGVWIDEGSGFVESEMMMAEDVVASCPVHPVFWADFGTEELPEGVAGTPETIDGIPTQRVDFTDALDAAMGMGLADDLEGAEFDLFDIWLADDGGWIAALMLEATLDADAAARAFGGLPQPGDAAASMSMDIRVADANDPDLVVEAPET